MNRNNNIEKLQNTSSFDVIVIGGGATGSGIALDATCRGLKVALFESKDFSQGTSSRSTKLIHGGVRYLAQANLSLVKEALKERKTFLNIAPHLTSKLSFIMPSYKLVDTPFYGAGLKLYDFLSGAFSLGKTKILSRKNVQELLPDIDNKNLHGGVLYWDAQFEDSRMNFNILETAYNQGAAILNYAKVIDFIYEDNKVSGVKVKDLLNNKEYVVKANCVINAAGVWSEKLMNINNEAIKENKDDIIAPSQGIHMVFDKKFWNSEHALIIPKTEDGRVLFIIPWLGKIIAGTTDTPVNEIEYNPHPYQGEINFILTEMRKYLTNPPTINDVKSIWVGLRPLVKKHNTEQTKKLSREHSIFISKSGLTSIFGGKWTTFRSMAEEVLNFCIDHNLLPLSAKRFNLINKIRLSGAQENPSNVIIAKKPGIHLYGDNASKIKELKGNDIELGWGLTEAMVRYAVREEMAITVEDVLAHRSRLLFLDARLAEEIADKVAQIMQEELGDNVDVKLPEFKELVKKYYLD